MPQNNNDQIVKMLSDLADRLDALSVKVDLLAARSVELDASLGVYPDQFITPKEALPLLKMRSTQGVYAACRSGQFRPGTELIDISPAGSERPTYLINVYAYFKRLRNEQSPIAS